MKSNVMKLVVLTTILACAFSLESFAQNYGGSAHVSVKDQNDVEYVKSVATEFLFSTQSEAREELLRQLKIGGDQFTGSVHYSITQVDPGEFYQGNAKVEIRATNGEIKTVYATIDCGTIGSPGGYSKNIKHRLLRLLQEQSKSGYVYLPFVSPVNFYNVRICD